MKAAAQESVYVGDTPEDVEMARAAGVRVIAVLGPFPTEKRLRAVKPEILLDGLEELPALSGLLLKGCALEQAARKP